MGIAGLQLMLDRGETQDWFGSTEIIIEAVMAAVGFYLFIVHMLTSEKKPFITPRVFKDRNLSAGLLVMFAVGMVLLAVSALLAPWLQDLSELPGGDGGDRDGATRSRHDGGDDDRRDGCRTRWTARVLMAIGIVMLSWSLYRMTGWTPAVSDMTVIFNTMLQGAGLGFVFVPLQVIAFATLEPALRTEGTALLSLLRNVGSAIGISVTSALVTRNGQIEHSVLAGYITPLNRAFQGAAAALMPMTAHGGAGAERDADAAGGDHRLQRRLEADDADCRCRCCCCCC